jgi:hypothetical protein
VSAALDSCALSEIKHLHFMMLFIRALRKGSRLRASVCLLLAALSLFSGFVETALAQQGAEVVPTNQSDSRQIAGKRGMASSKSVVNFKAVARQEALAPPDHLGRYEETKVVEPPEPMPENMPVPAGAVALPLEKPQPKALESPKVLGPSPAPSASFLASDDSGRIPPDTHGAVGLNHLMVVHNGRVRIQDRAGNSVSTVTLVGFWSSLPNAPADVFDPKVLYDPYANRWMLTACADRRSANSSVMMGVSQTSDPTGNWNLYRVDADATDLLWADYPSIGFNKDWIVVHMNMFPVVDGTGSFRSHLYVFNKANLYAGGQGLYTLIEAPNLGGTMVPAITFDSTLSRIYLLQNWSGNSGGNGYLGLYSITGAIGAEVLNVANGTFPTLIGTPNPWSSAAPTVSGTTDFAPQLSSSLKIQNNDSRMQTLVYRNGSLWGVQTVFLPAGAPTRAAVQWWELSTAGAIRQRGRIDDPTGITFYAFPSLAVNRDNDVLIGYSRYSPTQYVSGNYSFRSGSDPINSLRDDTVLKAGDASYYKTGGATPPRNRWGDFSGTVVDPINDKDMWTIQEYAAPPVGGSDKWGTWWGRVSLTAQPPPTLQLSATSYSVEEGAGRANLIVTRTGDASGAATVNYATSDTSGLTPCAPTPPTGIASSRCDYATTVGTLRFASGETARAISIPLVDDTLAEGTESLTLNLSSPGGAGLGTTTTATITITDNETVTGIFNPIDTVPFFVRQHYIDFLGREPDPVGYQGWQDVLNNCGTTVQPPCDRIEVSAGFFRSPEFQERGYFVYRFYSSSLGRIPRYAEFMPDLAKVSGFLSPEQLEANKVAFVNEFMNRQEFKTRYDALTDPTAYVNALVNTAGVNLPNKQALINELAAGTKSRAEVLRAIAESSEVYQKYYTEAFVVMQYFGYLRRDPDILYLEWIRIMNETNVNYRGMISGFMNSIEYRLRFGP